MNKDYPRLRVSSTKHSTPPPQFEAKFSPKGRRLIATLAKLRPLPVLLVGPTGWGKSVLVRELARTFNQPYVSINAHPGLDMNWLVGMWRPLPLQNGLTVEWQDGVLTNAVRTGAVMLFEELTRAPQEAVGRLFGLLDHGFRYWSLPESGVADVPVSPDFWMIATANPPTTEYRVSRLDVALQSRFSAIITVNSPIADEKALLTGLVGVRPAVCILEWADRCRAQLKGSPCTRDLVLFAEELRRGLPPMQALEVSVLPKYDGHQHILESALMEHRT